MYFLALHGKFISIKSKFVCGQQLHHLHLIQKKSNNVVLKYYLYLSHHLISKYAEAISVFKVFVKEKKILKFPVLPQ